METEEVFQGVLFTWKPPELAPGSLSLQHWFYGGRSHKGCVVTTEVALVVADNLGTEKVVGFVDTTSDPNKPLTYTAYARGARGLRGSSLLYRGPDITAAKRVVQTAYINIHTRAIARKLSYGD